MKTRGSSGAQALMIAAALVGVLVLLMAVIATLVNADGSHPVLSAWLGMLVVLAITVVADRNRPSPADHRGSQVSGARGP